MNIADLSWNQKLMLLAIDKYRDSKSIRVQWKDGVAWIHDDPFEYENVGGESWVFTPFATSSSILDFINRYKLSIEFLGSHIHITYDGMRMGYATDKLMISLLVDSVLGVKCLDAPLRLLSFDQAVTEYYESKGTKPN